MRIVWVNLLVTLVVCSCGFGQAASAPGLKDAIASLRNIDQAKMTPQQKQAKVAVIQKSWDTIIKAGPAGMDALKAELAAMDASGETDDFFRLSAGPLMWQIAGLDAAGDIAQAWSKASLKIQYNYVFRTAIEAAATQDPKALPILKALLKDREGTYGVPQHAMTLSWPITTQVAWGIFGHQAGPAAAEILQTSNDPTELCSALQVVSSCQHLPALQAIRKLAASKDVEVASRAIKVLGHFGHPDDFDLIASAAKSADKHLALAGAWALVEYEDMRAVAIFVDLVNSPEQPVAMEAAQGLYQAADLRGFTVLKECADKGRHAQQRQRTQRLVAELYRKMQLSPEAFDALPVPAKQQHLKKVRDERLARYQLAADDRKPTHAQLVDAASEWIRSNRLAGGKYAWMEDRHVLSVASPQDIDLLLNVRAAVLLRVSDECFSEAATLENLIRRIGRSRYRQEVGLCDKVQLPAGQQSTQPDSM